MLVMADLADLVKLEGLNRRRETNQRFPEAGLKQSGHRGNCDTLRSVVSEQDSDVLTGGDEVVLDLLPPKPAPTRPLKAVSVGRKTPFAQMLSAAAILPGRRFVGLRPQPIQFGLPLKPLNAPARLAGGTLCTQYTLGAYLTGSLVFPSRLVRPFLIATQYLPGGTLISVAGGIINKLVGPQ
jgi:hypothetical protein